MSFIISTQAEVLKTKRTASFWLSIIGAAFIPIILFFALLNEPEPDGAARDILKDPWTTLFFLGWQILSVFLLPMYIILTSSLITQIEIKNNTWKQVFASPQSFGNIFFSKFAAIHLMILFCFFMFNVFLILAGVVISMVNPNFTFLDHSIDWTMLLQLNLKTYIAILGITAIQYWISLRFKNFIGPVGIGLALVIASIIALNVSWEHIYKFPYAFATLTLDTMKQTDRPFLENHELNSIGYFVLFILIGFFDMKMRKVKG